MFKLTLDVDTKPGCSHLTDTQLADTGMFSDYEEEKTICTANTKAHEKGKRKCKTSNSGLFGRIESQFLFTAQNGHHI